MKDQHYLKKKFLKVKKLSVMGKDSEGVIIPQFWLKLLGWERKKTQIIMGLDLLDNQIIIRKIGDLKDEKTGELIAEVVEDSEATSSENIGPESEARKLQQGFGTNNN